MSYVYIVTVNVQSVHQITVIYAAR